jgi:transposase
MRIRYAAPIEAAIEGLLWDFSEHVYKARAKGLTYRQIAELEGVDRGTARRYARTYEVAARRYGREGDHPPLCNEVRHRCVVCKEEFTASRADARYCSNACRQDAYRKRKLGVA